MLNGKDYEGSPAEKMMLIVATIVANPIQEVNLRWENLDDQLVIILAAALRNCSSLTTLKLVGNAIGTEGAISLAAALPNCPALTTLNLGDNGIGNEGAILLAASLPSSPFLRCLDHHYNTDIDAAMSSKVKSLVSLQPQHKATAALVCWNRRRHTVFGVLVNRVFAAFLLGFIRVVCTDNSAVPDADPEMVEETLESLHRFDLEAHTLAHILAADAAATSA